MRKILLGLILLSFVFIPPVFADENDFSGGVNELMQHSNLLEGGFEGQQKVTDEDYQKALEEMKAKQNKGKNKKKKKEGEEFNNYDGGLHLKETSEKNLILRVPIVLINRDGKLIPMGHYKIVGEKDNGKVFLDFYQSDKIIARVPAIETQSDFDEADVNFVKLIDCNEEKIKIIYGSLDFNAYTFVKIKSSQF